MENRRAHFRIATQVSFQLAKISPEQVNVETLKRLAHPQHFLSQKMAKIDQDNSQLLKLIEDRHREIAAYLKGQDEKFDILNQIINTQQFKSFKPPKSCVVSPDAVALPFRVEGEANDNFFVELLLRPESLYIPAIARLVRIDENKDKLSSILQFRVISELDRDRIFKHMRQVEAKQRRTESTPDESES